MPAPLFTRRHFLGTLGAGLALGPAAVGRVDGGAQIRQVVSAWPFLSAAGWTPAELVRHVRELGLAGVELLDVDHWPLLKGGGLVNAATKSHGFVRGMNNAGHHAECLAALTGAITASARWGFPNVMTFTGMADTSDHPNGSLVDREAGKRNCIEGYKKIAGLAEKKGVTLVLEPLNSRVAETMKGHPGYQGDHIDYCVEIVRAVSSPGLKVLFDAYHVQIMDGDLIRRLERHHEFIGHVQIAGNPGRGSVAGDQEINYPALMKTLVRLGYTGYVAHEWIPQGDARKELEASVALCKV